MTSKYSPILQEPQKILKFKILNPKNSPSPWGLNLVKTVYKSYQQRTDDIFFYHTFLKLWENRAQHFIGNEPDKGKLQNSVSFFFLVHTLEQNF